MLCVLTPFDSVSISVVNFLNLFIKICSFFIKVIPGINFPFPVNGIKIKHRKITDAHCGMYKQKQTKAPFPQSGKIEYQKQQGNTYNQERDQGHEPELIFSCHISVGSDIEHILLQIHADSYVPGSCKIIGYYMKQLMNRDTSGLGILSVPGRNARRCS